MAIPIDKKVYNVSPDFRGNSLYLTKFFPYTTSVLDAGGVDVDPIKTTDGGGVAFVAETTAENRHLSIYKDASTRAALINLHSTDTEFENTGGILMNLGYGQVEIFRPGGYKVFINDSDELKALDFESSDSGDSYGDKAKLLGAVNKFATAKAIKDYVDANIIGLEPQLACDAAFDDSGNSVPDIPGIIDDVNCSADGKRVLVIKSDDDNGYDLEILTANTGAWDTLTPDGGEMVFVTSGTAYGGTLWAYNATDDVWVQIGQPTAYTAADGLKLTGIYSHFSSADEENLSVTVKQLAVFNKVIAKSDIDKVMFYLDGKEIGVVRKAPYEKTIILPVKGNKAVLKIVAFDKTANSAEDEITIKLTSAGNVDVANMQILSPENNSSIKKTDNLTIVAKIPNVLIGDLVEINLIEQNLETRKMIILSTVNQFNSDWNGKLITSWVPARSGIYEFFIRTKNKDEKLNLSQRVRVTVEE
jgi:hypothetical protein